MQEQMICPRHPHVGLEMKDGELNCRRCTAAGNLLKPAGLITLKELWDRESVPSFDEMITGVDETILDFLWKEKSGTLINLFLYFTSHQRPLDPREFLQFWGSLSGPEQDYYMFASAEGLKSEVKGEGE